MRGDARRVVEGMMSDFVQRLRQLDLEVESLRALVTALQGSLRPLPGSKPPAPAADAQAASAPSPPQARPPGHDAEFLRAYT